MSINDETWTLFNVYGSTYIIILDEKVQNKYICFLFNLYPE